MSHSTTSTSAYIIQKYSKAYTKNKGQKQQQAPEWQHFTNPALKVVLDKTKTRQGEVESLRLRIIWTMNDDDGEGISSQSPEDLDLFSFSNFDNALPQTKHTEGLPLKAVYRDTVVCIRYLHHQTQTYRRFQISFGSLADTTSFITSIQFVCPCKPLPANPPNGILNTAGTMVNPLPSQPSASRIQRTGTAIPQPRANAEKQGQAITQRRTSTMQPNESIPPPPLILPVTSETDCNYDGHITHQASMGPPSFIPTKPGMTTERTVSGYQASSHQGPGTARLPSSSPLPPSSERDQPNPSPTPSSDEDPILSALREPTALYNLSPQSLEHAVAEIVREDGFVKLMENLSSMWRVHALTGSHLSVDRT
ncbi:hypothetical protein CC1G_01930 [Coprinopsis cinerea okayama7|uniref:Uncharacterized protein n=1 Tax=Coprinopsis cinerea (strain Okayama-7 / 130 / ATCC MYA-4618 / FGSC 9003) TaxID=240176 RepID=A8N5Z9_COPC7|nr:hypothetical protein CC1G_01930 [Coprinopsis cinerea okayama7\|eukprot:XP_001830294.2 hypothetical protein CC1G_01930 [Coprinopsis cinerea okayama7\